MPERLSKYSRSAFLAMIAIILLFFTGCTVQSGPKEFGGDTPPTGQPTADARARLAKAFTKTAENGKRFMFSGWAITKIQKRNNGFYFTGGYDLDKGYNMDCRIFGQPFRYYRWLNDVYVSEGDKWRKVGQAKTPLNPLVDFSRLKDLVGGVVQLPEEPVLGLPCDVYQITLGSAEAMAVARDLGLAVSGDKTDLSKPYTELLEMKMKIWVGQKDGFVRQYETRTNMPVPGAGSAYQEFFCTFWDYNMSSVNLQTPDKLQRFLIKD